MLTVPRRLAALVVAGFGLLLLLLVLVTSSGPVDFVSRSGQSPGARPAPSARPGSTVTLPVQTRSSDTPPDLTGPDLPPLLLLLIQVLASIAVVMALVLVVRAAWRAAPRWRVGHREQPAFDVLPDVPEELTRSAPARMALLQEGDARNAIVACWLDLEEAAAAAGLPRRPAETTSEYTTRVLTGWPVDRAALDGLCDLYREARFSRHPLSEAHRRAAVERLRRLDDDLGRIAAARAGERSG